MSAPTTDTIPPFYDRIAWFNEARFGMFIHYGLYSVLGRHEWAMNRERIPREEYEKLAEKFTAENFDPRAYARLARETGMRYMCLTTKHHEGFCLWGSKLTDFNAPNSAAGRDLIEEYVAAARAEGLKVGLYFSLMDWHHEDGAQCLHDEAARKRFVGFVHGQVRELMTHYGKIDILWYDVPWPLKPDGWDTQGLNYMVRSLQPHILINNRSLHPEDFTTPEQKVVPAARYRSWETCMTMNGSWGYNHTDQDWKTSRELVAHLAQAAGGGGNFMLNIGPMPDGTIPAESITRLQEIGAWMKRNGASIYGTERADAEWMNFGKATQKGNTLYWHVARWYGKDTWIGGLRLPVRCARILGTGQEIAFKQSFDPPRLHLHDLPDIPPDELMPVIALEFEGKPLHKLGAGVVDLEGVLPLGENVGV